VKRLRNFLLYLLLFVVALILFAPKANLYFLLEEKLQPYGIVVDGEALRDRGLWFEIHDATLYAKEIESASAEQVSVALFGLYNRVSVEKAMLSPALAKIFPEGIDRIELTYALWDPMHVRISALGDFGTADALVSIRQRNVVADVLPSELMQSRFGATLRKLKQNETGGYRYETRF
jgi:hypothetical protein